MIDGTLNAYLTNHAGLAALISGRVYTDVAEQDTPKPYCVILSLGEVEDRTLTGHSGAFEIRRQVSCFAVTGVAARAVEAQVVAALKAWSAEGVAGVFIEDRYSAPTEQEDLFHRAVDVLIKYQGA